MMWNYETGTPVYSWISQLYVCYAAVADTVQLSFGCSLSRAIRLLVAELCRCRTEVVEHGRAMACAGGFVSAFPVRCDLDTQQQLFCHAGYGGIGALLLLSRRVGSVLCQLPTLAEWTLAALSALRSILPFPRKALS